MTLTIDVKTSSCRASPYVQELDPGDRGVRGEGGLAPASSGQDLPHHPRRLDARQSLVEPLEPVREPLVVEAEEVEDRGREVAHVHGVPDDVVGEVVGLPVRHTAPDPASREPEREAPWVMIAAVVLAGQFPLAVGGSAELSTPDDERVVEEAALLQVLDQSQQGWSTSRHWSAKWPGRFPWESHPRW